MRETVRAFVAATAVALSVTTAIAGVDADLLFKRITESRPASIHAGDQTVALADAAHVLLVRRADPTVIRDGEWVSSTKEHGDGAPLWLLIGEDARQVQRLVETAEIKTPEARKVGGIGTCSLYTPCKKCRLNFEETIARRKLHPQALRVQSISADSVREGQFIAVADLLAKRQPLLVFEDERAGETLNAIRSLATRSKRLAR